MKNPDKYIRKGISDKISGLVVEGSEVPVYDLRIPANGSQYIILSTQNKNQDKTSKCSQWDCFITIDVVTVYNGNTGSRVKAEDIMEYILNKLDEVEIENFSITSEIEYTFPPDITTITDNTSIFRKLVIVNFKLTEII